MQFVRLMEEFKDECVLKCGGCSILGKFHLILWLKFYEGLWKFCETRLLIKSGVLLVTYLLNYIKNKSVLA